MLAAGLQRHGAQAAGPDQPQAAELGVHASAECQGGQLQLSYTLSGPLDTLRIPPPAPEPQRRDGLWQHTCLEAFLALPEQEPYWELNLAPNGDWAFYRLDGYRRNLRPEPTPQAPALQLVQTAERLLLRAALPLPAALAAATELELALTAVLEHGDGTLSYWALRHPPGEADFHWRGGWRRCR